MKHPTLADQIRHYLQTENKWTHKNILLQKRWMNQKDFTYYMPSTVDRALRLLEEQKILAVRYTGNKQSGEYRYLKQELRADYITTKERDEMGADVYRWSKLKVTTN